MANSRTADIKALAFDTGGTAFDWHTSLVNALSRVGTGRSLTADWRAVANDWRQRSLKHVLGREQPTEHMDEIHCQMLDHTLSHFGLTDFSRDERTEILAAWYKLKAWPDFAPAIKSIRSVYKVISLTLLPVSLVVENSRRNGVDWDAIFSCEMIGTYKPHPRAYLTAAAWLNLAPSNILMVACHNIDLNAAAKVGYRTAFVHRRTEWGPDGRADAGPNMKYDFVEESFEDLARELSAPG